MATVSLAGRGIGAQGFAPAGLRGFGAHIAQGQYDKLSSASLGAGPFQLVSYDPERKIVVKRNPHYYDATRPYLDGVEVVVYPDAIAESSALIAGDTDLIATGSPVCRTATPSCGVPTRKFTAHLVAR